MLYRNSLVIGLLLNAALLIAACSPPKSAKGEAASKTASEVPESPFAVDTDGWDAERLGVEEDFQLWIRGEPALNEAKAQGASAVGEATKQLSGEILALREQFEYFLELSPDQDVIGWANLRRAQSNLRLGCELSGVEAPEDLSEMASEYFLSSYKEMGQPFLTQAVEDLAKLKEMAIPVWSDQAALVYEELAPIGEESCAATEDFWHPKDPLDRNDLLVNAAARCGRGSAGDCYRAAWFSPPEEAKIYLTESCHLVPEFCQAAALYFMEAGEDSAKVEGFLDRGCGAGNQPTCLLQAAYVQPRMRAEYQARCAEGDSLNCVKFVKALEEPDRGALHQFCLDLPGDLATAEELKAKCGEDGNPLSCLALGAGAYSDSDEYITAEQARFVAGATKAGGQEKEAQDNCDPYYLDGCLEPEDILEMGGEDLGILLQLGCDIGEGQACYFRSMLIEDAEKRSRLYEGACKNGYLPGCLARAAELIDAQQGGEAHREIVEMLQKGCMGQETATCFALAGYFKKPGAERAHETCALLYDGLACDMESSARCEALIR